MIASIVNKHLISSNPFYTCNMSAINCTIRSKCLCDINYTVVKLIIPQVGLPPIRVELFIEISELLRGRRPRKIGYCPKSGLFLFGNQSRFQVLFAFRKLTAIASTSIGGTILNRYAHSYLVKINKRYSDNNIHLRSRTQ